MGDDKIERSEDLCNPKSFEIVFTTYAKDLRRFMYFKTRNLKEAEDIVQDVFLKLWHNCANISFATLKGLLYTMANNLFLNGLKKKEVIQKHQKYNRKERTAESPEFLMIEEEYLNQLESAIAALPNKQREVFLLNRIEGKKYREISELLEISVKAVEKRMHLAILALKDKLGDL